jgi:L-amino acid N-acyltransferase YncA
MVRLRPMRPDDAGALLALFRSLPPEDLLFLRRDVTDERVLDAWARDVADGRVITILAETERGDVLGEASLYPSEVPWTRHVAEVRVITAPRARGKGLGRLLLREIMAAAKAAGIEKLVAQMTVEQEAARRLFERLGFSEEGRLRAHTRDQTGAPHDLVVMTATLTETAP